MKRQLMALLLLVLHPLAYTEEGRLPPPPEADYNSMILDYAVTGAAFQSKTYSDNWTRSYKYVGKLDPNVGGVLRVSGRAQWLTYPGAGKGYPWSVDIKVRAGDRTNNISYSPESTTQSFDLSVPIGNAQEGEFSISVVRSSSAGTRNMGVTGTMKGQVAIGSGSASTHSASTAASKQPLSIPEFGRLDPGEMPYCLSEVGPRVKTAAQILNSGTPYTIWAAPKVPNVSYRAAPWKRYGPWIFPGKERYIFNWDGVGIGGQIARDPVRSTSTPVLSPALTSLWWQNNTSDWVWLMINPLPPGCDPVVGAALPPASEVDGSDLSGNWQYRSNGDHWTFTRQSEGVYSAVENGALNARGIATVKERQVRLDYSYRGNQGQCMAHFDLTLAQDGHSASGTWADPCVKPTSGSIVIKRSRK
jgi:hypothetical protein